MIITKETTKTVIEVSDALCNKCGETCIIEGDMYGIHDAHMSGGYFSEHIDDGSVYKFDLCEKCAREFIDTFKIPALISNNWFPELNEQIEKDLEKSMEQLKDSVKETMDAVGEQLKTGGFIKFGNEIEDRIKKEMDAMKDYYFKDKKSK